MSKFLEGRWTFPKRFPLLIHPTYGDHTCGLLLQRNEITLYSYVKKLIQAFHTRRQDLRLFKAFLQ